jgi:hypothetical protein
MLFAHAYLYAHECSSFKLVHLHRVVQSFDAPFLTVFARTAHLPYSSRTSTNVFFEACPSEFIEVMTLDPIGMLGQSLSLGSALKIMANSELTEGRAIDLFWI